MERVGAKSRDVPRVFEGIVDAITEECPSSSAAFRQVARCFTQNSDAIARDPIDSFASECGVCPSRLMQFAQNFAQPGFTNFSP